MTERYESHGRLSREDREHGVRAIPSWAERSRLTPERAAEIRLRILERQYDSPQVAAAIARRLLERGDL
jgi:hypothetical protein